MRFFITGAAGFVGACLVRHLVEQGEEVHVLLRSFSNPWRVKDILDKIHVHEGSILDSEGLKKIIHQVKPNVVYHLAAYGAYPTKQCETEDILKTNFLGTVNLIKACEDIPYQAFINTGSSSEYGKKNYPMVETDFPEPYNDYGVAKAAASLYVQSYGRQQKRPILTYRLFSVYGPYEEPFRLIPSILLGMVQQETIRLSSPSPVRDFVYVNDVIEAYLAGIEHAKTYPGEIFNIGTGKQHSIGQVIELLQGQSPTMPVIEWGSIENPRTEPEVWCANPLKTQNSLGWTAQTDLEMGLRQVYEWFKIHYGLYLQS